MGKKFITLSNKSTRYRLYSEDIKIVFQKAIKKLPPIPRFPPFAHQNQSEAAEFCGNFKELTTITHLK
jgi:hypothetical protein